MPKFKLKELHELETAFRNWFHDNLGRGTVSVFVCSSVRLFVATVYRTAQIGWKQCCGSASRWCGPDVDPDYDFIWCESGFLLMRIQIRIRLFILMWIRFQILVSSNKGCSNRLIFHILMRIRTRSGSSLLLWYGSKTWLLLDEDPDFYLMRMLIKVTKIMRIRIRIPIHNTGWKGGEDEVNKWDKKAFFVYLLWKRCL